MLAVDGKRGLGLTTLERNARLAQQSNIQQIQEDGGWGANREIWKGEV
jgi:hypothetical protein